MLVAIPARAWLAALLLVPALSAAQPAAQPVPQPFPRPGQRPPPPPGGTVQSKPPVAAEAEREEVPTEELLGVPIIPNHSFDQALSAVLDLVMERATAWAEGHAQHAEGEEGKTA